MDSLANTTLFDMPILNGSVSRTITYSEMDSDNLTAITYSEMDSDNLTLEFVLARDPLSSVIPMTVIYVLIFITGLIGNFCTCIVIYRNRHMRTATNYYLFSLALSDLLLLVMGLPPELYGIWYKYPYIFGEAFCILRGLTAEMSTNASILTITCFTMERYLAICHPIRAHTMSKLSRVVKIIFAVWIVGGLSAVPMAIQFGIVFNEYEGESLLHTAQCTVKYPLENAFDTSTFVFFIIPMAIISVLYAMIGFELRKSESQSRKQTIREKELVILHEEQNNQHPLKILHLKRLLNRQSTRSIRGSKVSSRKAVIKMLFAVVVAFFICWAPFHCQRLLAIYAEPSNRTAFIVYTILTHISGVTYYVSATINPILYSIMSNKFRQAFKNTLAHCCRRNSLYDRGSSRYTSVLRSSVHKSCACNGTRAKKPEVVSLQQQKDCEISDCKTETTTVMLPQNGKLMNGLSKNLLACQAEIT